MRLKPLEKDVQEAIIQAFWVKYRITLVPVDAGGKGFRKALGGARNGRSGIPTGYPDLIGVAINRGGRFLAIEVKRPGEKVEPGSEQDKWLIRIEKDGGIAFWADSVESALDMYDTWQ